MLTVKGFKFDVGDTLVPNNLNDKANYLSEVVVEDIHKEEFMYSIIDYDGDCWQVSPIMLENEFTPIGER